MGNESDKGTSWERTVILGVPVHIRSLPPRLFAIHPAHFAGWPDPGSNLDPTLNPANRFSIDNTEIDFTSVRGLPDSWADDIITFGLVTIFLRGGLEIDLDLVKKAGRVAAKLTFFPGCSEVIIMPC